MCDKCFVGRWTPVNKTRYLWLVICVLPLYIAVHIAWLVLLMENNKPFNHTQTLEYAIQEESYSTYLVRENWRALLKTKVWLSQDPTATCQTNKGVDAFKRTWKGAKANSTTEENSDEEEP